MTIVVMYTILGSTGLRVITNNPYALVNLRQCWPEETFMVLEEVYHGELPKM